MDVLWLVFNKKSMSLDCFGISPKFGLHEVKNKA